MMVSHLIQIFVLAYITILFGQTSLDKLFNWRSNQAYIHDYFSKTGLERFSGLLFRALFFLEVSAFISALTSCINLLLIAIGSGSTEAVSLLNSLSVLFMDLALLGIFMGQRLAKDYASAASTTGYLLFALATTYLLAGMS